MGQQVDEIARHIQEQRSEMRDNVVELKHKATRVVDWRAQVRARPLPMLGLAFGGGVLLSVLVGGRRQPRASSRNGAESVLSTTLASVKGALIAMAASKVTSVVDEWLPGFEQEMREAQTRQVRSTF